MNIAKKIFATFLCVGLLFTSACSFLEDWQWQYLCKEDNVAYCSNDEVYINKKVKIKRIFEDCVEYKGYSRYYFNVEEYDDVQQEYVKTIDFNCCIYLLETAQSLKERGLQIEENDEIYIKGIFASSAGYSCFLVAELWKDGICYVMYEEGKATILEVLKDSKSYPY